MRIADPILIFLLVLAPAPLFAQGTISFANNPLIPVIDRYTSEPAGSDVTVGLYYSLNLAASFEDMVLAATTPIIRDGLFHYGSQPVVIPGTTPGTPVLVQIRGWFAPHTSYEEAWEAYVPDPRIKGGVGESAFLNVMMLGGGIAPPPNLYIQGGLNSFEVGPIPEPSIWGLALLAGGLAWIRRRRPAPGPKVGA